MYVWKHGGVYLRENRAGQYVYPSSLLVSYLLLEDVPDIFKPG